MAEQRVQIAYHFKIDPAKLGGVSSHETVPLPEQITRTVSVGDELTTEKVGLGMLAPWDRKSLREAVFAQIADATRVAKPVGETTVSAPEITSAPALAEEMSAF